MPYEEVLKRYGVACLIRIPKAEFAAVADGQPVIGHFNLGATIHRAGSNYLLVTIIRHGTYKTAHSEERPPLLSLVGARVMKCTLAEHNLPIDTLSPKYFEHSIGTITDPESLKKVLMERYGASKGGLTMADIEAKGAAFTLLEAVEE